MGPIWVRSPLGTVTRQFNSLLRTDRDHSRGRGGTSTCRRARRAGADNPTGTAVRFVVRSEAGGGAPSRAEIGCLVSFPPRSPTPSHRKARTYSVPTGRKRNDCNTAASRYCYRTARPAVLGVEFILAVNA